MHELAVCQALVDEVRRHARARDDAPVARVHVRLGPLSGIEPRLLASAFTIARAGACARAELCISVAPVRVECRECSAQSDATPNHLACAACGGFRTRLLSGDELILSRLEFTAARPAEDLPCAKTAAAA